MRVDQLDADKKYVGKNMRFKVPRNGHYIIRGLKYKLDFCFCLVLYDTRSLSGLKLSYKT